MYVHREIGPTDGPRLLTLLDEPLPPELVAKIIEAVALIAELDPKRYARLLFDLDAITIIEISKPYAAYMPGARTCYLGNYFLREYPASNLAILIAHEGTHARFDALHLVPWCRALKYRVEHRCLREELALASRFPRERFPDIDNWMADRAASSQYSRSPTRAHGLSRVHRHLTRS